MSSAETYALLEQKMPSYPDYASIPVIESEEPLVPLKNNELLDSLQIDPAMLAVTGTAVYVREEVADKLQVVAENLAARRPGSQLQVVYGYRALAIQRRLFEAVKAGLPPEMSEPEMLAAAHRMIAVPEVAGHPTGGAVDLQITDSSAPLDFGTDIWTFQPGSYTFSPYISPRAWQNRQLLREVMLQTGFAPFDGEWWHFSYGDKEWALHYNQPSARYNQLDFTTPNLDG
jgi:D-alanyl-D-alanine dipeptidase